MEALATSSSCPECRGDGYRVEAEVQAGPGDGEGRRARAVARVCSCREPCPHCAGRGFVYTSRQVEFSRKVGVKSYEALSPCVCRLLAQRVATFAQVGIPAHHATSSFATFRAKGDDQEKTAALEQGLGVARSVAQEWRKDRTARGFVISGRVGSGKTHLLSATLRHLILERGASAQ
jgi:DNA replication protein DnaC